MVELVGKYLDAGYDRIFINQIGPDQEGFFRFFTDELVPALAELGATPGASGALDLRTEAAVR